MILKYYGHSCFSMAYADGTILVTDPFDSHITYPPCDAECNAALLSHHHLDHCFIDSLRGSFKVFDTEGSHNIGSVSVTAMHSWHDHHLGTHRGNNLMMKILGDDLTIAHLGDLGHIPDPAQSAFLSDVDVLLVPIGGHYTIDTEEAIQVIDQLQPKIAIAMHYRTEANPAFDALGCELFDQLTRPAHLPNSIEITRENILSLPSRIIMSYK